MAGPTIEQFGLMLRLILPWLAICGTGCHFGQRTDSAATSAEQVSFEARSGTVDTHSVPQATDARQVVYLSQGTGGYGARSDSQAIEGELTLEEVLASVHAAYPLLESARLSRNIALGDHLSAQGQFDLKMKGASENGPVGFYETYRQSLGLVQPLCSGTEVWGGYRIGRGDFQPWYLERQTNDAGEFKAGLTVPLLRDRGIDQRRADLWRTGLGPRVAEFDIQAQTIGFVQEASYAYWEWVAAGQIADLAGRVFELAENRSERIRRQVELGLIDPPELTDNLRLVAERRAKLADAQRKFKQKASKLSIYLRGATGEPLLPAPQRLPLFPEPMEIDPARLADDVKLALANRPELGWLETIRQQYTVDLDQAQNELRPSLDAVLWASQDVGGPSSEKRDKSPLELEAGLYVDVPLQRRKARGKITALEAKIRQIAVKRQLMEDKIAVDVQTAYAALSAAFVQAEQTLEAVELAEELAQRERRNFEAGASDLLKVTLREQYAAEAETKRIEALLQYHSALADYRAATAQNFRP